MQVSEVSANEGLKKKIKFEYNRKKDESRMFHKKTLFVKKEEP